MVPRKLVTLVLCLNAAVLPIIFYTYTVMVTTLEKLSLGLLNRDYAPLIDIAQKLWNLLV